MGHMQRPSQRPGHGVAKMQNFPVQFGWLRKYVSGIHGGKNHRMLIAASAFHDQHRHRTQPQQLPVRHVEQPGSNVPAPVTLRDDQVRVRSLRATNHRFIGWIVPIHCRRDFEITLANAAGDSFKGPQVARFHALLHQFHSSVGGASRIQMDRAVDRVKQFEAGTETARELRRLDHCGRVTGTRVLDRNQNSANGWHRSLALGAGAIQRTPDRYGAAVSGF